MNGIIKKLQDNIIGETSDVVKAKMTKSTQKGKTTEKVPTEIESYLKLRILMKDYSLNTQKNSAPRRL